jgi:sulfite reductase (NADPH) flavoprotein alpha-component
VYPLVDSLTSPQVGQLVPAYIHKNPDFRLPPAPSTPILMVGPGTGLAPFRSYILHRLLEAKQQGGAGTKPGQMVLYFGCR